MDITAATSMAFGRGRFEADAKAICKHLAVELVVTEDRGLLRSHFTLLLRGDRAEEALSRIQEAYPPRSLSR